MTTMTAAAADEAALAQSLVLRLPDPLRLRVESLFAAHPASQPVVLDLLRYLHTHSSASASASVSALSENASAPTAPAAPTASAAPASTGADPSLDSLALVLIDLPFVSPLRKKLHLALTPSHVAVFSGPKPPAAVAAAAISPSDLALPWSLHSTELLSSLAHVLCLPTPDRPKPHYSFVWIFKSASVSEPAAAAAQNQYSMLVFGIDDKTSLCTWRPSASAASGTLSTTAHTSIVGSLIADINASLPPSLGISVSHPSASTSASRPFTPALAASKAFPHAHVSCHVKAKEGALYLLDIGIFFGFKKPTLFFGVEEDLVSMRVSGATGHTFNLEVTCSGGVVTVFEMIDLKELTGVTAYIQWASKAMAASKMAKNAGHGKSGKTGGGGGGLETGNSVDAKARESGGGRLGSHVFDEDDDEDADFEGSDGSSEGGHDDEDLAEEYDSEHETDSNPSSASVSVGSGSDGDEDDEDNETEAQTEGKVRPSKKRRPSSDDEGDGGSARDKIASVKRRADGAAAAGRSAMAKQLAAIEQARQSRLKTGKTATQPSALRDDEDIEVDLGNDDDDDDEDEDEDDGENEYEEEEEDTADEEDLEEAEGDTDQGMDVDLDDMQDTVDGDEQGDADTLPSGLVVSHDANDAANDDGEDEDGGDDEAEDAMTPPLRSSQAALGLAGATATPSASASFMLDDGDADDLGLGDSIPLDDLLDM